MRRNAHDQPTITAMRSLRGLTAFELLGIAAILVIAAVVFYPLVRSATGIGSSASQGAARVLEGAAAEAPSDRMPMLIYIESTAEGEFFLFRRFHWGALIQSYLEELGVYTRRDRFEAYKDPFEGVYLWATTPNTGSEFLNPTGDPYRMPRSEEEVLSLFGEGSGLGFDAAPRAGMGFGFGQSAQPSGFEQPGLTPRPGMMPQPGLNQPTLGEGNALGQPGGLGAPTATGNPHTGPGLGF